MMEPVALVFGHLALNVCSNICFKRSALSRGWRRFILWQIAANLTGFGCVLAFTFLLRFLSMSVAFPLTQGFGVLGVQLIAARVFFKEKITLMQWIGTGLILLGIILLVY